MFLLILFAFFGGIVTILSPCILPLLPIILSGSVGEGKRRPFGIVIGFIASFSFFTLFLSLIIKATGIPADVLRTVAIIFLFVFALFLIIPQLQAIFEKWISGLSARLPQSSQQGFSAGFFLGLSLGLVWSPCVGPILASVITLAATSTVSIAAFFITVAYAVGTAIPMFLIMFTGRKLLKSSPWLLSKGVVIQKIFSVAMMLMAIAIFFNLDRSLQTWVVRTFPSYGTGLTRFEEIAPIQEQLQKINRNSSDPVSKSSNGLLLESGQKAPDFSGSTQWLNSEELSLQDELKGKVVLVDFWTYSCINCIRTLPFVTTWYEKYKDQGFVVIGVHAPEFEFEKVTKNVEKAITDFKIEYPVVQDNDFTIWRAYQNQYWPAHYLIDKNGDIRYTHFGEGNYLETENAIRALLDEAPLPEEKKQSSLPTLSRRITPEIYLGWSRAENYSRANKIVLDQTSSYQLPQNLVQSEVGLGGDWRVQKEQIVSQKDTAQVSISVTARDVYLVLAPPTDTEKAKVRVLIDGKPISAENTTDDMNTLGEIIVREPRKYDIAHFGTTPQEHTITLEFSAGIEAFAFTFG